MEPSVQLVPALKKTNGICWISLQTWQLRVPDSQRDTPERRMFELQMVIAVQLVMNLFPVPLVPTFPWKPNKHLTHPV
jgi:hypothetical protein